MIKKSIKTHTRLLTCLVALAVVFATFLAGTFTTQAGTDVFGDIELKVGDTLGFVYYTSQPYTETTTMRFTVNGRTSESKAYSNDGKCVFIFNDIYPHELAKEVTATIVVDGQETVSSTGLSIKNFLLQMLMDKNSSKEEKQFASDTLQYGEQTRLYRNANVDVADRDYVSITDDINTSIYENYTPQDIDTNLVGSAMGLGVSASNIRLSSIGISYHNTNRYVVTLQVPTNSNVDLSKIKVKIGDKEYTSTSFIDKGKGKYEIQSDPINAYDIMADNSQVKTTQFTLSVNGKRVQQASYNILDYIYQLQDTTQGGSLALKYARSLYRYGQSAEAAYKGNRVVSISLNQNPGDDNGQMVPGSQNAQTPTGGSITAYYSDGTSKVIGEGVTWNNTDIYGNEIKIEDDTHLKQFTVHGTYTDEISGKTFTVTGQIELHNDMKLVERYTDPDVYSPTTFNVEHTPTGAKLKCIWSNGYQDIRPATNKYISMGTYQYDEYGFIPTTASYTDPQSGITLGATTFLLYKNPIQAITLADTTADFDDGNRDNTTTPNRSEYTITYQNGRTQAAKDTDITSWGNTIQSGASSLEVQYKFSWSNLVYNGYDIDVDLDAIGTLTCPAYGTWERMVGGKTSKDEIYQIAERSVKGECIAATANGEIGITIAIAPSVYGGTVTSTADLSGNPASTTNGQLAGGSVYMHYHNNAKETLTNVLYSSPTITDTAYNKTVNVTASYIGKNGQTYTHSTPVEIFNKLKDLQQAQPAIVHSSNAVNTRLPLQNTANTLKATYTNGTSELVGNGQSNTTNITIHDINQNSACYVQSITTGKVASAIRTTAGTTSTTNTRYSIILSYDDYRTNAAYDGSIRTISDYQVKIVNTYASIKSGQYTNNVTMTSATEVPTPTGALIVILSNGKEYANVIPTAYTTPTAVTSANEMEVKDVTAQCTASDGTVITGTVKCRVVNPAVSATTTVDPAPYTISGTGKADGSKFTGGKVRVTFLNGQTSELTCTSYTTNDDTKITDTTMIKLCAISGTWRGTYTSATATDMHIALQNPPKSAALLLTAGKDGNNRIKLTTSGATPTGTVTITYSNGQKTEGLACTVQTIGVGGAVNNNTKTTARNGTATVQTTTTHPVKDSASVARKGVGNVKTSGSTFTPSTTAYWTNPLTSLTRESGWIPAAKHTVATLTASNSTVNNEEVTAHLSNGATIANQVPTLTTKTINNCTDTSKGIWQYVKASLTLDGVTVTSDFGVFVDNGVKTITVDANNANVYFDGSEVVKDTNINVTLRNEQSLWTNAEKITTVTDNNTSATYDFDMDGSKTGKTASIITTYTESGKAKWTNTYQVTFRTNLNGNAATQNFTVNYYNEFDVTIKKDGATVPYETGKAEDKYIRVSFNDGSTTAPSSYEGNILVTFDNGATKTLTLSSYLTTDFDHGYYSRYVNGESFSSKTTANGGSLRKATVSYTLNGLTASDSCYAYTRTSRHGYYFTTGHVRQNTYPTHKSVGPDVWKATVYVYGFWYNRPFNNTTTNGNHVKTDNNGSPLTTEWYSQSTSATTCKESRAVLNTAHVTQLTTSDFSDWPNRYFQCKMPSSITMTIGDEAGYECDCLATSYRYSYQCVPSVMGYQ